MSQGNYGAYDPSLEAGGSNSVAGTAATNAPETGLAGIGQAIFGQGPAVTGPNAAAYNNILGQGQSSEAEFDNAQAAQAQAAQISNPFQAQSQAALAGSSGGVGSMAGLLGQTAIGKGPAAQAAQAQMQAATGQNIASQMAMARSATGGALSQNAAQLAGQGNLAATQGQAAAASQQTMAGMENAAAGQAGQLYGTQGQLALGQYGLEQQQAQQQAALQQQTALQNAAQQNTYGLGMGGLQLGAQGAQTNALNAYTGENLTAQGLQGQLNQQTFNEGTQTLGAVMQAAASVAGAGAMSDVNTKANIQPEGQYTSDVTSTLGLSGLPSLTGSAGKPPSTGGSSGGMSTAQMASMVGAIESDERAKKVDGDHRTLADAFLDYLHPASYTYKDPQDEPRQAGPNGGKYLGVMAQDVERAPSIGSQMVSDTPRGKVIEPKVALSAVMAGLGRLHERVKELEGSKHG